MENFILHIFYMCIKFHDIKFCIMDIYITHLDHAEAVFLLLLLLSLATFYGV